MHDRVIVEAIGGFHSVGEWDIDVPVQNCPGRRGLLVGDPEDAGIVAEVRGHVAQEPREFSADLVVGMLDVEIRPVHEHVFLDGVAVQVEVEAEPLFVGFLQFLYELQEVEGFREGVFSGLVEGAVEVLAEEAGAVVAGDDAVGVEHGNHVEDVASPQLLGRLLTPAEILHHSFCHVGRIGLTGMYSPSYQYHLLVVIRHFFVSDLQHRHSQPRQRLHRRHYLNTPQSRYNLQQLTITIGDAVCKLDGIVGHSKIIRERHRKKCV